MNCITPTPPPAYADSAPETPLAPRPSYTFRSIRQNDAVDLCLPSHQLDAVRRPLARRNRASIMSDHQHYGSVVPDGQSSPVGVNDLSMPCLDDSDDEDEHYHHHHHELGLTNTVPRVSLRMRPITRDIAIGLFPELEAGSGDLQRVYHHDDSSAPLTFRPLPHYTNNYTDTDTDTSPSTNVTTTTNDRFVAMTPPPPCFIPALVSTPHSLDGQSYEFYEQCELFDVRQETQMSHSEFAFHIPKELDLALPEGEEGRCCTACQEDVADSSAAAVKKNQPLLCRSNSVLDLNLNVISRRTIRRSVSAPALHRMTKRTSCSKPDCFVLPFYRQMQRLFDGVCVAFS